MTTTREVVYQPVKRRPVRTHLLPLAALATITLALATLRSTPEIATVLAGISIPLSLLGYKFSRGITNGPLRPAKGGKYRHRSPHTGAQVLAELSLLAGTTILILSIIFYVNA